MIVPERYAKCKRQLVNLWQNSVERASKYALACSLGFNSYEARRMRDWRVEYIMKLAENVEATKRLFERGRSESVSKGV